MTPPHYVLKTIKFNFIINSNYKHIKVKNKNNNTERNIRYSYYLQVLQIVSTMWLTIQNWYNIQVSQSQHKNPMTWKTGLMGQKIRTFTVPFGFPRPRTTTKIRIKWSYWNGKIYDTIKFPFGLYVVCL